MESPELNCSFGLHDSAVPQRLFNNSTAESYGPLGRFRQDP